MRRQGCRDLIPRRIEFKPDWTNKFIYRFEISEGGKRIKKLDGGGYTIYNNAAVLPKTGIHYFQIKVIQSQYRWILVGICGKNIKDLKGDQAFRTPFLMGYDITIGHLFVDGKNYAVTSPPNIVYGQTVIGMEIDMNKKWFTVYIDRKLFYATEIRKLLTEQDIYPYVMPHQNNDIIEFVE